MLIDFFIKPVQWSLTFPRGISAIRPKNYEDARESIYCSARSPKQIPVNGVSSPIEDPAVLYVVFLCREVEP